MTFMMALYQALSGNLQWFAWVIIGNVYWLFAFGAVAFFFKDGSVRKSIPLFLLIVLLFWIFPEVLVIANWEYFAASFLALHFIVRTIVILAAGSSKVWEANLRSILIVQFLLTWTFYNVFLV